MKRASTIIASFLLSILLPAGASAAPLMAFGYLANRSHDSNYDYLETIFPNSFAGAIHNVFNINVIKPGQIREILKERGSVLEKEYQPYQLMELTDSISADYFIYGAFMVLPQERIKINITLYDRSANKIFTFTNSGKMETEIFRLVDRIAAIIIDFLGHDNFFMAGPIPAGTRIGILTNLDGHEINQLYSAFLAGKYNVAGIQAAAPDGELSEEMIEKFRYISAEENSFQLVSDPRAVRFLHGTWTGNRYYDSIEHLRELYRDYDTDYRGSKFKALNQLAARYALDKILIIGFNRSRTSAWVRCIDIRSRELVWLQSNITGGISAICATMIKCMSTGARPH